MPEIILDTPGAGLPLIERLLLKGFITVSTKLYSWEKALKLLNYEIQKTLILLSSVDQNKLDQVVVIEPLFGLEDSSRAWSLNMVVEHLVIVDMGMMKLIAELNSEQTSTLKVDPAEVKPSKNKDQRKILQMFIKKYEGIVIENQGKRSPLTHPHPWFGELTNHQWHIYLAFHHKIHRRQIQQIIKEAL